MRTTAKGFTLIELLIVVAILSIMAAASMRMIVAPMQESRLAQMEQAQQSGVATLIARLVEEAHTANGLRPVENGLVLEQALSGGGNVAYRVNSDGVLRREVVDAPTTGGVALLENVTAFAANAETTAGLWTIRVEAKQSRYGHPVEMSRRITLAVGGQP